ALRSRVRSSSGRWHGSRANHKPTGAPKNPSKRRVVALSGQGAPDPQRSAKLAMEQSRLNVQMTISPTHVTFSAWAVCFACWMVAALWSSRVERRSRSPADLAYRLLTAMGAVLLFDPRLSWRWGAAALWRTGNTTGWILVAMTISGFVIAWWARITLGRL